MYAAMVGFGDEKLDIFEQEFYFQCLNHLLKDSDKFLESKEGFTYVPKKVEEGVTQKVLTFLPSHEVSRWGKGH